MSLVNKILLESRLTELFDSNQNFYQFEWDADDHFYSFNDDDGNNVHVLTEHYFIDAYALMGCAVEFSVNDTYTKAGQKASARTYIKTLNTVVMIVKDLIESLGFEEIRFTANREGKKGYSQRGQIYTAVAEKVKGDWSVFKTNKHGTDIITIRSPELIKRIHGEVVETQPA